MTEILSASQLDRAQLRRELRARRNGLLPEYRQRANEAIQQFIEQHPKWQSARKIGAYLAVDHEVETQGLINQAWLSGKFVYLPRTHHQPTKWLDYYPYTARTELAINRFGAREPATPDSEPMLATDLDWVLVPIVGIDQQGYRVGWGTGYFDRVYAFLNTKPRPPKPRLIALAYDCQRLADFSPQPWDVPMDALVTESGWMDFS